MSNADEMRTEWLHIATERAERAEARLEEVQADTAAFTQEATAIASTLLSWRQGPQGDNDLVWQHNDEQVWGRLEALLERGRAVRARLVDDGEQV